MEDDVPGEPLFRANKRRKVFRKRVGSGERPAPPNQVPQSAEVPVAQGESEDEKHGASGLVRLQRKGVAKKRGIGFTSSDAPRTGDDEAEEKALVVANQDGAQEVVRGDRFVKPTGKVAVAQNKHMVAYIDSKMAEMRSSTSTPLNGTTGLGSIDFSPEELSQIHAESAHSNTKPPAQTPPGPVTYDQSQARSTRVYERPTKRRKPAQRDQTDMARDSIIDQIMQESQVPLYDRSGSHTPADDVDNDAATAEAFKAQLLAEMEEQNRRRPPPHNPAAKGEKVSHGPKLGGSRAQREKMRAAEEAKSSAGKK